MNSIGMISQVTGIKIIESPLLSYNKVPNTRVLYKKRWMEKRCYYARVIKKWGKIYGWREHPQCYYSELDNVMYVPKGGCERLKSSLMKHESALG